MIREGDRVKIKTEKEEIEGVLMPSSEDDIVVIKLDNGYNIGMDKHKIKEMKLVEKHQEIKGKEKEVKEKKGLPTIAILHTGGTIASKVDYSTGAVKPKFTPAELLELFPELENMANIKSKLLANLLSENLRFGHFNLMAKEIEKIAGEVDGIIVTHGTDVLHYSAAALAFALEDIGVPVILVGAQRSSDRGSSDAAMNLICAAQFIVKSDFAGVALCMHKAMDDEWCGILPATKTRKFHSSRRDTFKVINDKAWAEVSKKGEIKWIKKGYNKKDKDKKLKLKLFKEDLKVGIIKSHPNMFAEEFKGYEKCEGLILEGTGLGHFPVMEYDKLTKENAKILKEIEKLAKKKPVVMTTQTIYGRVDMNVYAAGRELLKVGVLGNYSDMTTETAFVKLAWLLSNKMDVKENMGKNLRGEINERIEGKKDFLE